jgi:hypothetical protein
MERKSLPLPKTLEPGPASQAAVTPVYQASGTVPQLLSLFTPKEDSGKLNLKAIYIDRLATVSQSSNIEHMSTEPWIQNLLKHLDTPYFSKINDNDSDSDNGGESIFQVLLRTLLLDCYWSQRGLPVRRGVAIKADAVEQYKNLSAVDFLRSATAQPSYMVTNMNLDKKDVYLGLRVILQGRRLAVTEKGFLGIVDETAEPGDHLALLIGSKVLHVLRPCTISGMDAIAEDVEAASTDPLLSQQQRQPSCQPTQALFFPQGQENEYGNVRIHVLLIDGVLETRFHQALEETCEYCTEEACQTYQLVGEAYMHWLMDGEAQTLPLTGGIRHITLV